MAQPKSIIINAYLVTVGCIAVQFLISSGYSSFSPLDYRLTDSTECNGSNSTQNDFDQTNGCSDICSAIYDPVCGRDESNRYREFSNGCVMGIYNCENPINRKNIIVFRLNNNYEDFMEIHCHSFFSRI